jgi:quercetin dioxygenase-like cupin family protein
MSRFSSRVATSDPDQRKRYLWAGNSVFDVILDEEHTGGAIALLDYRGSRGDATPLHVHRREAEIFYLLSGTIRAWAGDDVLTLNEGSAIYLPPKQAHALRVESDAARILIITNPAGFADFVRAAGMAVDNVPSVWDFDVERIMRAAPEHDIDIVGPPPA